MKIGVFAYNFEHKKTQEGLLNLFLSNIKIDCILAADPVELKFYQSKIRISPKELVYTHPKKIAEQLNVPYHVVVHNGETCEELIKKYDLDLGIILGARILKENIINAFKVGVLNMHPGMLPENRGLDNLKWAVLKDYKQGVSCHLIDKYVDKGKIIIKKEINVFEDDTMLDILLRIQNLEQQLMVESVHLLEGGKEEFEEVISKESFKAVSLEEEAILLEKFESYKRKYNRL